MKNFSTSTELSSKINFEEIERLCCLLGKAGIPYERCRHFDGWRVLYPSHNNVVCDAILITGSFGWRQNTLEILGLNDTEDNILGYLSADNVYYRIYEHYHKK